MPEMKRVGPAGIDCLGLMPLAWDIGSVSRSIGRSVGRSGNIGQLVDSYFLDNDLESTILFLR